MHKQFLQKLTQKPVAFAGSRLKDGCPLIVDHIFPIPIAGNPYTETGERFQIPDILANRERADLDRFLRMAHGQTIPLTDFAHDYSASEASEIVSILKKLIVI